MASIKTIHSKACLTLKIVLFWLLTPVHLFAQNQDVGLPFIKNYYPSEYRAHVQNFDVVQDSRGVMYFANFRGVLEFDGQTWRIIQTSKISQVTSLAIDSKGIIYVGGAGEIGYLQPDSKGELTFKSLVDSLKKEDQHFQYITSISATKEGIYFVTDVSILLWNGFSFTTIKSKETINSAFYVGDKLYFFEKGNDAHYLQNNQVFKVQTGTGISEAILVKAMIPIGASKVVIATDSNGLMFLDEKGLVSFPTSVDDYLRQNSISCGLMLKDRTIALGTERGALVILYPDGTLKQIVNKGIQNDYIRALYIDNKDVLWLALDNGISRIELPSYLTFFDDKSGIDGGVNQVLRNNGNLYFATNKGLYYYDNNQNKYTRVKGINSACWSILPDSNSIIAATSKGVFLSRANQTELITNEFSFTLLRSKINKSNLYVGQLDGIMSIENVNGRWISRGKIQGLTDEITEIQEDKNGFLWAVVATRGLVRVDPKGKEIPVYYDHTKGLPSRFGNHINKVESNLFVTTQNGMFAYDSTADAFSPLKTLQNDTLMPKEWHSKVVDDIEGNIWSNSGDETHIQFQNRDGKKSQTSILLKPLQDKTISTIYPEPDGKVWFGGTEGAICFDPEIQENLSIIPTVLIRSVSAKGDSLLFGGAYFNDDHLISTIQPLQLKPNLDYSYNTLIFKFASPSFSINEIIEFQYFLEGFDTDSSLWNKDFQKEYTNLPPGQYKFWVRARNIYGLIADPATFEFSIKKPFYKTILAYILYASLLLVVLYSVVRLRSRKLLREKRNLENLIKERTAEVVSQKEEIEKQSVELSRKNDELEKINLIVKSINSEIHFTSLLQSILEKTKVIGGVEKATMLVRDKSTDSFSFKAGFGWDISSVSDIRMTLNEIEEFYLRHTYEVFEDIFDVKKLNTTTSQETFRKLVSPESMLIMLVRVNDVVEGFLILENMHKKNAFKQRDFSLLHNLKEHIISAFIKTIILEDLQTTLVNLKETQEQLIQQEKMASIGQLTKGIVDRILNPLNYINNFSLLTNDLSVEIEEILDGLHEKMDNDTYEDLKDLIKMIKSNVLKVNEHGSSASRIVKGMEKLLKERSTTFVLTDINSLVESHLGIALQQYTADNKDFKIEIIKDFDNKSEKINVLPSELGSVIVNTFENACYAVDEKMKKSKDFKPEITVSTHFSDDEVAIIIRDNGNGIPELELKKLFAPFFTTKPTSKGTGLGLYLNMDIVKSHKGTIEVESKDGEFTAFIIKLPKNE